MQKTDTGHIKRRIEALRAGHIAEYKVPQGMSSEQILYGFKELIYYGQTDKPSLVLITGSSLTHPKIVDAEKYAMKNQKIMRLVELNQSLVPHIQNEFN
jgi:hypothetical protein